MCIEEKSQPATRPQLDGAGGGAGQLLKRGMRDIKQTYRHTLCPASKSQTHADGAGISRSLLPLSLFDSRAHGTVYVCVSVTDTQTTTRRATGKQRRATYIDETPPQIRSVGTQAISDVVWLISLSPTHSPATTH
mmetsp:Transcript_21275/g.51998  ORF Transcript_21275/g.51998 Transcript_21275/m.51998 type:complete len:135 (-) Transcript_21275:393-797(-)